MASQLISSERRFKSLWMKQEEPADLSTVSADPTSLAKVDVNHEISFPQFIGHPSPRLFGSLKDMF